MSGVSIGMRVLAYGNKHTYKYSQVPLRFWYKTLNHYETSFYCFQQDKI